MGSVGQRVAKLPAFKNWEWFKPGPISLVHNFAGMAEVADFFLSTLTLTAGNFKGLSSTDPKILALKYLNLIKIVSKV